ncbi:hypothetical protein ACLESD_02215 [Pyxidicoccus sp. 3LFB2]
MRAEADTYVSSVSAAGTLGTWTALEVDPPSPDAVTSGRVWTGT